MEGFPSIIPDMSEIPNSAAELMDEIMEDTENGDTNNGDINNGRNNDSDSNFHVPKALHSQALCVVAANGPVTTLLVLRLVDIRTCLEINKYLVNTGRKLTVEEFPLELLKSPKWRRWFRRLVLPYLCREHWVEGLAKVLLCFVRDHTVFRPSSMSQEEVEGRVVDGWRVNLYLRNRYREQAKLLQRDYNPNTPSDQPDGMENIRNYGVTSFVQQELTPERCFNFLLAWKYFETFVRFVVDWKSLSAQNRRWVVWIFIHEGARYMEAICQGQGESRIVGSITAEMRSQAEWPFIQRFARMNSGLRETRVAHVEELLRSIRVRVSGLGDVKFMDTLRAFNNFQAHDNLGSTQNLSAP